MNNITFKQYRNIDLSILAALLLVSEWVATMATKFWFSAQPIAISTSLLFILIVMMRWGGFAAIHALLGGLIFTITSGATAEQTLIYAGGNLLALIALFWFKAFDKEKIRENRFLLAAFSVSGYLGMQIGRWLISLCFGHGAYGIIRFLSVDIISLLFALVIMQILRDVSGMIEDQKTYLLRLDREKRENAESEAFRGYGEE